jgi:Flp pilus assembly protein TadG
MNTNYSHFMRDQSGSVAIVFALCFTMLVAAAACAIDFGYAAWRKGDLQHAADAAALVGAKLETTDNTAIEAEARRLFIGNVVTPGVVPAVTVVDDTVTVEASYSHSTVLAAIFGQEKLNVAVRAVARRAPPAVPCVTILELLEKKAIDLNSNSKLDTDCKVQVNSKNAEALVANNNSVLISNSTCVVGGWTKTSNSTLSPLPTKCAPLADPLASLPLPPEATAPCKYTDFRVEAQVKMLSPGVYCKNTDMKSSSVVTLSPGTYVFRDGVFKINSSSKLIGTGVMLVFVGAHLEVDSSSVFEAVAPTSGVYSNILIYQDRKDSIRSFMIHNLGAGKVQGTIYLPNGILVISSQSAMVPTSLLSLIVRRLELNSYAKVVIRNNSDSSKQKGVALIK